MDGSPDTGPRLLDAARRELAATHLAVAQRLARRYFQVFGGEVPMDDLAAEARFALVRAAACFDPERKVPFVAYAAVVVKRRLARSLRRWQRDMPPDAVLFTELATPTDEDGSATCDPACPRSCDAGRRAAAREVLERVRQRLSERSFQVLQLHFLEGRVPEEISTHLGVSRRRARQLLEQAVRKVRQWFPRELGAW